MFGTGVCPKHEVISEAAGALTNTVKEGKDEVVGKHW